MDTTRFKRIEYAMIPHKTLRDLVREIKKHHPQFNWCKAPERSVVFFIRTGCFSDEDAVLDYLSDYEFRCIRKLLRKEIYPIGGVNRWMDYLPSTRALAHAIRWFYRAKSLKEWRRMPMKKLRKKWAALKDRQHSMNKDGIE